MVIITRPEAERRGDLRRGRWQSGVDRGQREHTGSCRGYQKEMGLDEGSLGEVPKP